MPSANYLWPQLLNKWTRNSIEENGGEVVLEEYFPLDQMEYSATIGKIKKEKVTSSIVLLSPACSSLDEWRDFEERGNAFIKFVKKI